MNHNWLIHELSDSYLKHKRLLRESEYGVINRTPEDLKIAKYIVAHTEIVVEALRDKERFIIYNEVILGKTGDWYRGYLSPATYYRHRKKAYEKFLRCLND